MDLDQHPDQDAAAAARDPNAAGVELADDLGSERPGPVWFACMQFPGLEAGRRIVELEAKVEDAERVRENLRTANEGLSRVIDRMRLEFDATAAELRAQRDRAERLLQEQATEIRVLRERVRKATETKSDSVS